MKYKEKSVAVRTNKSPLITAGELYSKIMDSEKAHTSFGELVLADEISAPQYCNSL